MARVVAICGKGRIAVTALSYVVHYVALEVPSTRVVVVPTADDQGYDKWYPSLARVAAQLGVARTTIEELESEDGLLLVSLEYDRIIRVDRFKSRRLYNIHFSALPKYRGVLTSIWPILNGETHSGVTLHEIDAGVDTGAIVTQRVFSLGAEITARKLFDMYHDEGLVLFRDSFPTILTSIPSAAPQVDAHASSYNRRSLDLTKREVDLSLPAARISAFVRAYIFPEYQLPTVRGRAIQGCAVLPIRSSQPPGSTIHDTARSSALVAGDGNVVEFIWA